MANHKNVFLDFFTYGTLASLGLCLMLVLYWSFYPYKVIEYKEDIFKIAGNKVAAQGGVLAYEYTYEKYISIQAVVTKQFVDGVVFTAESAVTYKPVTVKPVHVHSEFSIPATLPPGKYRLRIVAVYKVNPIREIIVIHDTEEFTIIAGPHSDSDLDK